MNLVIDQGNTKAKIAIFKKNEIISLSEKEVIEISFLERLFKEYYIESCIFGSVNEKKKEIISFLRGNVKNFIELTNETLLPITIGYKTPLTLGIDRIAAVVGASIENLNKPIIVIDAGTAITYDFLSKEGEFVGGNIAPGITMRLKSLNQFTHKLPLVEMKGETPIIGFDTQTAIRSGVINGICYEIIGFISQIESFHPSVLVFLTGGDSNYLSEKLKYRFFVDKNLVLKGLNRILNYNVEG